MKVFVRPNITPRSGYYYDDPDTGMRITAELLADLIQAATRHRQINQLHIPENFPAIVEDWLCGKNPDIFWAEKVEASQVPVESIVGGSGIVGTANATISLLRVPGGGTLRIVDKAVAEERTDICLKCTNNVADKACYSCTVEGAIKALLKVPSTPKSFFLSTCKVCNCFNKAQVHLTANILASKVTQEQVADYPEACWKHQTLKEYYNDKAKKQSTNKVKPDTVRRAKPKPIKRTSKKVTAKPKK